MARIKTFQMLQAFLLSAMLWSGDTSAESIVIEVAADERTISVAVKGATVEQVLDTLAKKKTFSIERIGSDFESGQINRSFSGPVRSVVEQLLEHENHLIYVNVRSREVERVVIYGRRVEITAEPAAAPSEMPPAVPADALVQATLQPVQTEGAPSHRPESAPEPPSISSHRSAFGAFGGHGHGHGFGQRLRRGA